MAKKAVAHIEVEGQDKPLFPYHQVVINQHIYGHHEFEIHVPVQVIEGSAGNVINASREMIGKAVKISMESQQLSESQSQLFVGLITHLGFARHHGSGSDVVLRGKSPTVLLERGLHCRTFAEMNTTDIANEVLGEYPSNVIPFETGGERQQQRLHTMQYQETDWQFLSRMANRIGGWFYYDGEKLYFDQKKESDPIKLVLGSDLHSFDLDMGLEPVGDQYEGYQYLQNEFMSGAQPSASALQLGGSFAEEMYNKSQEFYQGPTQHQSLLGFESQSALDEHAKTRGSQQGSRMVHLRGNSENIQVKLGTAIDISGYKTENRLDGMEEYGKYTVIHVRHRVEGNGNYQNIFEAIPSDAAIPPANPGVKQPRVQPQPAVVTDTYDPEGLGRVKVQFLWQGETPWIRVMSAHAAADRGFFFIPEVGDEVLIGFEYNDPDQPFVMGSLYHGNNRPNAAWDHQDNDIKSIRTKSGNEIQIVDTPGEETIKIVTGDGANVLSLTMADGGTINFSSGNETTISSTTINISASDTLNIDATDININASSNIAVSSGADTSIDAGGNISTASGADTLMDAGANLSASAGANADLAAGANMSLDAGVNLAASAGANAEIAANANAKVAGNAMASLESSAMAKVSAATVNVEGQAMTNVSGGIVKLN